MRSTIFGIVLSHATVHRIWRAHALEPHQVSTFKFMADPEAEAKIHDVVGLYLNPPTNAVVLSLDEKTQIQALSRTQPLLPLRPGLPAHPAQHTGADFLRFMKRLARRYRGRRLHVVLDNSSTHSTPAVQAWLGAHPEIQFHFTPPLRRGSTWWRRGSGS
jgi:DDE superfamily endonuclease